MAINANERGFMREDFERWFFERYSNLFNGEISPLNRDSKGIYTDRGTLGMWIVWSYKEREISEMKVKIKQFLIDKGFYHEQ